MSEAVQWNDLQFFLAVCEKGTLAAAAKWLRVNHSTVVRRIGSLETTLACRLFDRLPVGYVLTPAGAQMYAALGGITAQIEGAQRRIQTEGGAIGGMVRLTSSDTLARSVLLSALREFRAQHPAVGFDLVIGNDLLSLTQRQADIAVRATANPPENLLGRRVGTLKTALYGAKQYLEALGDGRDEERFAWVSPDASLSHVASYHWVENNVPAERIAFRYDSLGMLHDAVLAGQGVGLLACALADRSEALTRLSDPIVELESPVWVLTHPDLRAVPRIKAVMSWLAKHFLTDARFR